MAGAEVATIDGAVVESLVARGDLSGLPAAAKAQYYIEFCRSLGLDPKTQPFQVLKLNGREVLYAGRGATDQLARNHSVTRELLSGPEVVKVGQVEVIRAVCRASLPDGRSEVAAGLVPAVFRTAEEACNAFMKCETKAKRRATLSLLGLGMMDESETDTLPDARPMEPPALGAPERDPQVLQQMAAHDAKAKAYSRVLWIVNPRIAKDKLTPEQRAFVRQALLRWACEREQVTHQQDPKAYTAGELTQIGDALEANLEDALADVYPLLGEQEADVERERSQAEAQVQELYVGA